MKIFGLFRSKNPLCGLDLGSTWIKTVKVSRKGKSATLESFARMPWSSKGLDGTVAQEGKLRALWEHLKLRDNVVVSSMAGLSVIVKRVFLTAKPAKELEKSIFKEARQYIPFDLNDVYLDYQVMGKGGKQDSIEVLLVASKKKMVQELIKIIEQSGLSLGVLDVDAFALSNCFEYNYPEFSQQPVYLLDIGGNQSVFIIFWQGQPVFFREISFGGRQLTDIIARTLDTGRMEAEKKKIAGPDLKDSREHSKIAKETALTIKSWAEEVKRLIGFYQSSVADAKQAEIIFLSGGGSLFKGIDKFFQEKLEIETKYLDPWKNLQTTMNDFDSKYLDSVKPQFAVATGLALRGVI